MSSYVIRWPRALAALATLAVLAWTAGAQAETVLRIVPQADLKILDTVWTTNNITSNHGYMIYDVLFAPNAKLEYKPQMVDSWEKSSDGLVWKFKLRDGLKFSFAYGRQLAAAGDSNIFSLGIAYRFLF